MDFTLYNTNDMSLGTTSQLVLYHVLFVYVADNLMKKKRTKERMKNVRVAHKVASKS